MQHQAVAAAALEDLLRAAVAAPSIHNTQPWRFRLDEHTRTVEVSAAPERELALADRTGRALHLSVGAAVFNLRTAAAHQGWEPVTRLLPDPARPQLLAAVHLAGSPHDAPAQRPDPDLYEAIRHRHSSRLPFTGQPVPPGVLEEIRLAAEAEQAELHLPGPAETARLMSVTSDAEHRDSGDPARRSESASWSGVPADRHYGIPAAALGPEDADARLPMRDFQGRSGGDSRPPAHFERNPQVVLIGTRHDHPADWLRAGQAMERVLLVLTARGVRASFLHQALEWTDLRWLLRDPHCGPWSPQVLLRIGYGPEGAATPREMPQYAMEGTGRGRTGGPGRRTGPR